MGWLPARGVPSPLRLSFRGGGHEFASPLPLSSLRSLRPAVPRRAAQGPAKARRLPLATVAEAPALADDVLYGVGRIDASGRVGDRAFTSALGWRPGDRLTLTAADGVVIARRDPAWPSWPARPYVVIPSALRRRCGLAPGEQGRPGDVPGPRMRWPRTSFAVVERGTAGAFPVARAPTGETES